MNFIFLSPNFPKTYWHFTQGLKNNGVTTLGIGDCPYEALEPECRDSLVEYYKVSSLENYDEVYRAVAFFAFKYGKIDWLETNNEYWLLRPVGGLDPFPIGFILNQNRYLPKAGYDLISFVKKLVDSEGTA